MRTTRAVHKMLGNFGATFMILGNFKFQATFFLSRKSFYFEAISLLLNEKLNEKDKFKCLTVVFSSFGHMLSVLHC